jgi:tight adherence protein B
MNLAPHGPLPLYAVGLAMGIGLTGAGTTLAARRRPHQSTTASITRNWTEAIDLPSLALSLIAAGVSAVVTGWPVAGLLTGIAVYGVPRLLRQTSAAASIATLEAIATWTEMLQGTLAASAGLGQAIIATADLSPVPIRSATEQLAAQIRSGVEPRVALLRFADEVADPCADRVVCSLLLAFSSRAQRLGDLLTALAESTREEVSLRLRVETSRASVRSGVRTVVVFSVAFAALLALFARSYLAPFGTVEGQLVLVVVGGLYAAGLTLMVALARPPRAIRLLGADVEER